MPKAPSAPASATMAFRFDAARRHDDARTSGRKPAATTAVPLREAAARVELPAVAGDDNALPRMAAWYTRVVLFVTCTPGLEPALAEELRELGFTGKQVPGGFETNGDAARIARESRIA